NGDSSRTHSPANRCRIKHLARSSAERPGQPTASGPAERRPGKRSQPGDYGADQIVGGGGARGEADGDRTGRRQPAARDDLAGRANRSMSDLDGRHEAFGIGDMERGAPRRADASQITRVAAVVAAD